MLVTLLLIGTLSLAVNIKPVRATGARVAVTIPTVKKRNYLSFSQFIK
jgi:hypothetical protein